MQIHTHARCTQTDTHAHRHTHTLVATVRKSTFKLKPDLKFAFLGSWLLVRYFFSTHLVGYVTTWGGGMGPAAVVLAHSRFYVHTTNIPQATKKSSATVGSLCWVLLLFEGQASSSTLIQSAAVWFQFITISVIINWKGVKILTQIDRAAPKPTFANCVRT